MFPQSPPNQSSKTVYYIYICINSLLLFIVITMDTLSTPTLYTTSTTTQS